MLMQKPIIACDDEMFLKALVAVGPKDGRADNFRVLVSSHSLTDEKRFI